MTPSAPDVPSFPWLLLAAAFVIGAIPFGFLAGRMRGIDLREHGSRSIGATNVLRTLGKGPGATVLLLDVLKGFAPTLYARQIAGLDAAWVVAVGLAAVLGHIYSPFVRFRGGKGVATGLGVLFALSPPVAGVSLAVFAVAVALTRWVSLGSILGAATQAILFCVLPNELPYRVFAVVVAAFVIFRHRDNIRRILAGTENRLGAAKTAPPPPADASGSGQAK